VSKKCLFASQVGIAGCVIIEDQVTLWGQVGVKSDVTLEEGVVVYAQGGVAKSLKKGTYFGSPAEDVRTKFREIASLKKLPEFLEKNK